MRKENRAAGLANNTLDRLDGIIDTRFIKYVSSMIHRQIVIYSQYDVSCFDALFSHTSN